MTTPAVAAPRAARRITILVTSVFVMGVCVTWAFLSMRAVMDVGGACADGGPYVSAQPCPSAAWLIGPAIPVMLLAAFAGSFVAATLPAPNLLVPMWAVLFGSLGWNFLEYGFTTDDGAVWAWIICGVVFELMAAPALYAVAVGLRTTISPPDAASQRPDVLKWWLAYPVLGAAGAFVGLVSFHALS